MVLLNFLSRPPTHTHCSHSSCTILHVVLIAAVLVGARGRLAVALLGFSLTDVEHLFMCLLAVHIDSLEKLPSCFVNRIKFSALGNDAFMHFYRQTSVRIPTLTSHLPE